MFTILQDLQLTIHNTPVLTAHSTIFQELHAQIKELQNDIDRFSKNNKDLMAKLETANNRNDVMNADLEKFKEYHLAAKNKVTV